MSRSESKISKRITTSRERENTALELRKAGYTCAKIGQALGISGSAANQTLCRALARLEAQSKESAADYRRIQLERLDGMLTAMWKPAINGDPQAVDRVLKIEERRSKLLGLDAPEKTTETLKIIVERHD
jgi:DNA-binding CsgD family transcriptional regulator